MPEPVDNPYEVPVCDHIHTETQRAEINGEAVIIRWCRACGSALDQV